MDLHEAQYLAVTLMARFGLIDEGWFFRWDRSVRRFGRCSYTKKVISLSKHITELNNERHVRDTILHEIAHALTPHTGHGPAWRVKCEEIGAMPERCYSDNVKAPSRQWRGTCPQCQRAIYRHRRRQGACGKCYRAGRAAGLTEQEAFEKFKFQWSVNSHATR